MDSILEEHGTSRALAGSSRIEAEDLRECGGKDAALVLVVVAFGPYKSFAEHIGYGRSERRRLHCKVGFSQYIRVWKRQDERKEGMRLKSASPRESKQRAGLTIIVDVLEDVLYGGVIRHHHLGRGALNRARGGRPEQNSQCQDGRGLP